MRNLRPSWRHQLVEGPSRVWLVGVAIQNFDLPTFEKDRDDLIKVFGGDMHVFHELASSHGVVGRIADLGFGFDQEGVEFVLGDSPMDGGKKTPGVVAGEIYRPESRLTGNDGIMVIFANSIQEGQFGSVFPCPGPKGDSGGVATFLGRPSNLVIIIGGLFEDLVTLVVWENGSRIGVIGIPISLG